MLRDQQVAEDITALLQPAQVYRIEAGDVLHVVVWDHPELSAPMLPAGVPGAVGVAGVAVSPMQPQSGFEIDQQGMLDFPYAGKLKLAGLTTVEAHERVVRSLSRYLKNPKVTMRVLTYRSKRVYVDGLDILFVRELTGGVYFGEPRGVETIADGQRRGVNTHVYTTSEIHRVARIAFELARARKGEVVSAEKGNVMEAGLMWREDVQALRDAEYPDIKLSHMLADNMAMQLVKNPRQFDVILTDNLFGDILSDEAAMLTGSLGAQSSGST